MKPGTLVMLRVSEGIPPKVPNGAIDEVVDIYTDIGSVVVMFPRHPSPHPTATWSVLTKYLIPLSDPDIDVSEEDEVKLGEMLDKVLEKV
ncbi:MAG: hypothetical protein ACXW1D_00270 [Halobacteriota archaeon]